MSHMSSPMPLDDDGEVQRKQSISDIVFNLTSWKDIARSWMMPDKLLDNKGQEPKDMQIFTSQMPAQTMRMDGNSVIATYHGEPEASSIRNVIKTNMSLSKSSTSPSKHKTQSSMEEGNESKMFESQKSFAALKWWDVYKESFHGSKEGLERDVMMRPSVRHIKGVNALHEGLLVSVNASQYAVLVTDIPRNDEKLDNLRRSFTGESKHSRRRSGTSFDSEDPDCLKMFDPTDDITAEVFKQVFPDSFRHVVPVQDFSEVTKYLLQWDRASQNLEVQEALFEMDGQRRTVKTGFLGLFGEKVDAISHYQRVVEELNAKIKYARRKAKSQPSTRSSFVIFDNQVDAAMAAQSVLFPLDGTRFVTHRAPGPDNINWLTLFKTSKEKFVRRILMLPLIAIIMVFPAGLFSAALGALDKAFCQQTSEVYWQWYCETDSQFGELMKRLVTGWLPSLLVTLWQNLVVMRVFYMVALVECVSFSLGGVDRRITSLYFYWGYLNIFIGAILGAGALNLLGSALALNSAEQVLTTIGVSIAASANFLTNYALLRALLLVPLKLVFPHPGILGYIVRNLLSLTCCRGAGITRRQRYQAWEPKSFMYGREAGNTMVMGLIGVAYIATSPITVAVVACYFIGFFVVCRHHLLYVYARNYESGGELWPVLFDRFVIMLITLAYFTAFQLITNKAWLQAVIILLTTPIILFKFHSICTKRYKEVCLEMPLDIAWRQPRAEIPPQMYIPSELRHQSIGWHPEQGKAWSGYGMPRWL